MLQYLERKEIDPEQWDTCVAASEQQVVYAYAWYLDAVCTRWGGIVEREGDHHRYLSVFPVPYRPFLGLRRVNQPSFTQQLGLFTTPESQHRQPHQYLTRLLSQVTDIHNLQLNTANTQALLKNLPGLSLRPRVTYHLSLAPDYPVISYRYSTNLKRNLKRAQLAGYTVTTGGTLGPLLQLFQETKGQELAELRAKEYGLLERLHAQAHAHGVARQLEVWQGGVLVAGGLFLEAGGKIVYLFGATSAPGRQSGAMAFLLNHLIRERAGSGAVLDFEGSDKPGIARFYASFGGLPQTYVSLEKSPKPWYLQWIK